MKILFIANRFPYPPFRGDKLKIYNLCKRLSVNHEIHLITFTEQKSDLQYLDELKPIFKRMEIIHLPKIQSLFHSAIGLLGRLPLQVQYFKSAKFKKQLEKLLKEESYDAIHVQHIRMAQYALPYKNKFRILDLPDAFSLYWQRRKEILRSFISRMIDQVESARVIRYEKFVLNQFNLNLVCSQEDLEFLKENHHVSNIDLLPNGVDTNQFKPGQHSYEHASTLLFTGNMDYDPNVDAVLYFTQEIFPIILKKFPKVKFVIAGQRPIDQVKALDNGDNVLVTGFIPDLADTYNSASVVVAPLRFGAGTQNKVLEAMSMGIPVVCSNIGFKGLGIQDGEGAFMRIQANDFANQVMALLENEDLRRSTGLKGIEVIQKSFTWETISQKLSDYLSTGSDSMQQ